MPANAGIEVGRGGSCSADPTPPPLVAGVRPHDSSALALGCGRIRQVVAWSREFRIADFGLRIPQCAFHNPQWLAGEADAEEASFMINAVTLPELGENIDTAEVLHVLVSVGDSIDKDQALIEVETEKASVEVPTPAAGVVKEIRIKPGDTIRVGQVLVELESATPAQQSPPATDKLGPEGGVQPTSGPSQHRAHEDGAIPAVHAAPLQAASAPSVRRLARELGLDIADVTGSGPGGRISAADVMQHARMLIQQRLATRSGGRSAAASPLELPDFSSYGSVEREPMSGVRRKTAQNMSRSWVAIPHVTQFDRADITELEQARKHFAGRAEAAGSRLTLTAVVIKVVGAAVGIFPKFNASIDAEHDEIVYKKYVNIGVAVDTDHGLLVPVIRDVDKKTLISIGRELTELSERARARKSPPEDLRGANLTVTNLGSLGTTYFTPLINWPEVAVVGVGRARYEAVYCPADTDRLGVRGVDNGFLPRLVVPLSVSYDHRLIDGADAARFLRWIAEALEHPLSLALDEQ
jgi:pyruvate dehydrogenase E2 component (dihydrolipoamide acetyltransferase)